VFALVVAGDTWIEANFKENQLTHMRVGQQVEVHVDSYPGKKFDGTVVSVSPGTGSQFSLLPAENATGNWVKVVQRLPVRIELRDFDPEFPLHGGLSATVNVDTRHERHLFGSDDPPHATSPNTSSSANSPAAASGELAAAK
jgi:membrane fusion protein (multidrug efflux system)